MAIYIYIYIYIHIHPSRQIVTNRQCNYFSTQVVGASPKRRKWGLGLLIHIKMLLVLINIGYITLVVLSRVLYIYQLYCPVYCHLWIAYSFPMPVQWAKALPWATPEPVTRSRGAAWTSTRSQDCRLLGHCAQPMGPIGGPWQCLGPFHGHGK